MSEFDFNQIRRLDGGLLLIFRELLRRRRASEVADTLGLSASAVSHALTRLRDLFQDPLFIRRPHGFEPTRRALELEPKIEQLVQMAGMALGRSAGFDPSRSERVFNIAAPEFLTALIGAPLIQTLSLAAPKVIFNVGFMSQDVALNALRRGDLDIALGRFGDLGGEYVSELLYEDRYCVAARRGHPRIDGHIDFQAYAEIGHVYASSGSESGGDTRWGPDEIKALAVVPQWLTALALVAGTDAIATCPRRLAERHAERLALQVLDPPFEPMRFTVSAVRRQGADDAGVAWFLDQVRRAVEA